MTKQRNVRRLDQLEALKGPGRVIVWYPDSGEPKPDAGPDDVLIVVEYMTDELLEPA